MESSWGDVAEVGHLLLRHGHSSNICDSTLKTCWTAAECTSCMEVKKDRIEMDMTSIGYVCKILCLNILLSRYTTADFEFINLSSEAVSGQHHFPYSILLAACKYLPRECANPFFFRKQLSSNKWWRKWVHPPVLSRLFNRDIYTEIRNSAAHCQSPRAIPSLLTGQVRSQLLVFSRTLDLEEAVDECRRTKPFTPCCPLP